MTDPINPKLVLEAIDRIARTPDGVSLYLFCQNKLMTLPASSKISTLRKLEGERSFALEIIGHMTKGLIESGGRPSISGSPGSTIDEQPIVFAVPKPVAVGGPRGAGRRIGPNTRVPGYDPPDSDDAA
jgi:hypothetical protein